MRRRRPLTRIAAIALALGAFTAPAAVAQQDLRSPDTRDAAAAGTVKQDLRSPDARDAARPAVPAQDLRSPDTREAAIARSAPIQAVSGSQPVVAGRPTLRPVFHASPTPVARPSSDKASTVSLSLLAMAAFGIAALTLVVRRRSGMLVAAVADGTRDWRRGVGL
jgi:hypothetical protein